MSQSDLFLFVGILVLVTIVFLVFFRGEDEGIPEPAVLIHDAFSNCELPNLSVRDFAETDSEFCRKLHSNLFKAGLSPDIGSSYIDEWMEKEENQKWIVTSNSKPVACFGLT